MKQKKYRIIIKCISAIVFLAVSICGFSLNNVNAYAHSAMLDVEYDDCVYSNGDGIDETWYILDGSQYSHHISHETFEIKYYFEDKSSVYDDFTWTKNVSEDVANDIKNAYADSMKKWNDVYFYSYNENNQVIKHKIINISEGTADNHNLTIYPETINLGSAVASTVADSSVSGIEFVEKKDKITHVHCPKWNMFVHVVYFYEHGSLNSKSVNVNKERTGAHEIGHVLGLTDVDKNCSSASHGLHHEEILMGYGLDTNRAQDITYKDIAGVAITRGFHTDKDHKWLNMGKGDNGYYKLVCSICNGVKKVLSINSYDFVNYGICNENHSLSSGNMMAVASYGTKDYYKCKYCRYVAPFSELVPQNYSIISSTKQNHKYMNYVDGLNYIFLEDHIYTMKYYDYRWHKLTCECGQTTGDTEGHTVLKSEIRNNRYATCLGCNTMLDLNRDMAFYLESNSSNIKEVSLNGSFILPSGIIVLVDEDLDAYLDGTLLFYSKKLESV